MRRIIYLLLCGFSIYGMNQQKLIKKVLQDKRGAFLINTILEETKNVVSPQKNQHLCSKLFLSAIKQKRAAVFKRLSYEFGYDHSVVRESGGSLTSSLVFPCPDTFMATIKSLVRINKNDEIVIDNAAYEESKKHQIIKDEKDYTELALKYPELFLAIDVYRANNMDPKKIFVYDQLMKLYDFEVVEDIPSKNPTLFSQICAEQKSRSSKSDIRSAYADIYDKIASAIARHEVQGKTSLGDIYTCDDKVFYLNFESDRLNNYYAVVHEGKRWKKQRKIIRNMRKDLRRFIFFERQASAYLKNNAWEQNNKTDQTIIREWGGNDTISILEPYNELYDESLCGDLPSVTIKLAVQQQAKTSRDYEPVKQKAPRLTDPECLTSSQPVSLEEATILEENGFYGITGLHMREFLKR